VSGGAGPPEEEWVQGSAEPEPRLADRDIEQAAGGLLAEEEAADLHGLIDPAWARDSDRWLRRRFSFEDFRDAFGFATRVALLAEQQGHHPDFEIGWGRVVLVLTSHSAGGLTRNDFVMAAKIDLLVDGPGPRA
jgi:4a-hydroxytetrahydrobiopterin dehydratase